MMAMTWILLALLALGSDWPQWRGIHRDGNIEGVRLPENLPQKLNRVWTAKVGVGHSSPVLAGGHLFIFAREGDREVVYSLDPVNGKTLWKQSYPAPYKVNSAAASHGPGPKSTPLVQDGKLVTFGISGILSCWDTKDGRLIWRKEFAHDYTNTSPTFGTASSPMVDNGLVIANIGGDGAGAMAAFDLATGAMKWRCAGDGPGYASPIVAELVGVRQIVTQTQQNIVGIRADSGELLWRSPYSTDYVQNAITPLLYKDTLIIAGLNNPTYGMRVVKEGAKFSIVKAWENPQAPMYMSSPVLVGDTLFGFTHKSKGQFFGQDAKTGKVLWSSPGRQGDNAALEVAGNSLFALKDDADLLAIRATPASFEPVRTYKVADSATYAHPVITEGGVFVKDVSSVAFWSWK